MAQFYPKFYRFIEIFYPKFYHFIEKEIDAFKENFLQMPKLKHILSQILSSSFIFHYQTQKQNNTFDPRINFSNNIISVC